MIIPQGSDCIFASSQYSKPGQLMMWHRSMINAWQSWSSTCSLFPTLWPWIPRHKLCGAFWRLSLWLVILEMLLQPLDCYRRYVHKLRWSLFCGENSCWVSINIVRFGVQTPLKKDDKDMSLQSPYFTDQDRLGFLPVLQSLRTPIGGFPSKKAGKLAICLRLCLVKFPWWLQDKLQSFTLKLWAERMVLIGDLGIIGSVQRLKQTWERNSK